MADLVQFRGQVTAASTASNLQPVASRTVLVTKRGATISAAATSKIQAVYNGENRFSVGDKVVLAGKGESGTYTTVDAVGSGVLQFAKIITTVVGDRVVNLGADTGGASPNYDGADSLVSIYSVPDSTATAIADNKVTTDADGEWAFYAVPATYDVHIMDSDGALGTDSQTLPDQSNLGNVNTSDAPDVVGAPKWSWDTTQDNDLDSEALQNQASVLSIHTQWLDKASPIMTLHGLDTPVHLRVGKRAQTTLTAENVGVFVSHAYDDDKISGEEINGIFALTQAGGNLASGANSSAIFGEFQYDPSDANDATASVAGISGIGKYIATNASSTMGTLQGIVSQVRIEGSGTLASGRGLQIATPTNTGSVAGPATVTQYIGLYNQGPTASYATNNSIAIHDGAADEAADFAIHRCPVRIDDNANISNFAVDGRWVDIYRTWDGADTGSLFAGVHLGLNLEGTFTAGDDGIGFRAVVQTNTTAGDGANLDEMIGYQAVMLHASDQNIDEMVGVDVSLAESGTGEAAKTYAIRLDTPPAINADHTAAGHIRHIPFETATPATTIATLTGAQRGDWIFIRDTDDDANSGPAFFDGTTWVHITAGGVAAIADA